MPVERAAGGTSLIDVLDRVLDKGIVIDWDADETLYFLGERQDLLEIAGNAIENACKFGRSKVRVRAEEAAPARLCLLVEDDGPGLPAARHAEVLQRRSERAHV